MEIDLNKRKILKSGVASVALASTAYIFKNTLFATKSAEGFDAVSDEGKKISEVADKDASLQLYKKNDHELAVRDNIDKHTRFDETYPDDIFLSKTKINVFQSSLKRILRVQNIVGYANFNLISFDDMLLYAHRYPKIGRFSKEELALIDELFFFDANKYGFYGSKVIQNLTSKINKKETIKITGSGHFLFQGDAVNMFHQLRKDVGPNLILTSGVRSIVKQLQLFLEKLDSSNGNLSMASRSLAPPGHSYHGIGDFDVGKKDFGKLNFTSQFATTSEYNKLINLGYVDLRYTKYNQFGVRYEPWHIKVV
jgi:hypothetical protein